MSRTRRAGTLRGPQSSEDVSRETGPNTSRTECCRPHPPLGLNGAPRDPLERPRWPKMAPRGPQRAHDGLQEDSRYPKRAQYGVRPPAYLHEVQSRLQNGSKCPRRPLRTLPRCHNQSNTFGTSMCLHSPLFATDGHLRPQGGSRKAQESPRRGPRVSHAAVLLHPMRGGAPPIAPQDGPGGPQDGPTGPQDGSRRSPREVTLTGNLRLPSQDASKKP